MGDLTSISIIIILISVALLYPPIFVFILVLFTPKLGIWPLIFYLYFISGVYYVKNKSVK